jgi:hypothetical protein
MTLKKLQEVLEEFAYEEKSNQIDKFEYVVPIVMTYKTCYGTDEWIDDFVYKYLLERQQNSMPKHIIL